MTECVRVGKSASFVSGEEGKVFGNVMVEPGRRGYERMGLFREVGWGGYRVQSDPIFPRTLTTHHDLLLNWFKAKGEISAGIVEGFNNKAKRAIRKGYGFKSLETMETTLYLHLGQLPEADHTHRFC